MNELEQYIKSYFGLEVAELAQISSMFHLESIEKGHYYLKEGMLCDKLSFVQSGLMRIYAVTPEKEVTQWISTKGFFITDLSSFIFDTPARWTIQSLAPSKIYTINKADYIQIGRHIPRWHQLEKLFIAKCFTMLEDRIFSHLSMSAEERYHSFFKNNKELFNEVPLQYIASMLGMTPETFSRIRKRA
jgi:CRP-like cAMP-binding protein